MGFWNAVASAGPYANNQHPTPDRQPHQHHITHFLQARCSSWHQTNSVKALQGNYLPEQIDKKQVETVNQGSPGKQPLKWWQASR